MIVLLVVKVARPLSKNTPYSFVIYFIYFCHCMTDVCCSFFATNTRQRQTLPIQLFKESKISRKYFLRQFVGSRGAPYRPPASKSTMLARV